MRAASKFTALQHSCFQETALVHHAHCNRADTDRFRCDTTVVSLLLLLVSRCLRQTLMRTISIQIVEVLRVDASHAKKKATNRKNNHIARGRAGDDHDIRRPMNERESEESGT